MKLKDRLAPWWGPAVLAMVGLWISLTPPLAAMVANLAPLGAALVFIAAFTGLGLPIASRLTPAAEPVDQMLLAVILGSGLTGLVTTIPATFGVIDTAAFAAWTVLGLATGGWWFVRQRRAIVASLHAPLTSTDRLSLGLMAVVLMLVLPAVSTPVASTDAMEYHLMIPRLALGEGVWGPMPNIVEAGYPYLASSLYLLVMPLAGDIACKGLHFWFGLVVLVAISRLTWRIAPDGSRWLAPALYLSMPVAGVLFSVAWNDHLFVAAVLVALSQLVDHHSRQADDGAGGVSGRLLAAGLALGVAAWTKYTIVLVLLALAPLMLMMVIRRRWRPSVILWTAVPVLALSLLVFGRNWVFLGNPFYPFLHDVFPSPFWSDASATYFHDALRRWEIPEWRWHSPITFIWHVVFTPRLIDIHTGILPLAMLPFAFGSRRGEGLSLLRWYCVFQLGAWFLIQTETRSLLTLIAVLMSVSVPSFERLILHRTREHRVALAAVAGATLASLGILAVNLLFMSQPITYFIRQESRADFLQREVVHYRAAAWLNGRNDVSGALLVGLKRPYYVTGRTWFSAFADAPAAQAFTRGLGDVSSLHERFLAKGVSHIVVHDDEYRHDHQNGLYTWTAEERAVFEELLRERCDRMAEFGPLTIYRLR